MLSKFSVLLIQFYQTFISTGSPSRCRFYPTCSCYAKELFKKLPFYKALFYTLVRIAKCHPFHPGGVDLPCRVIK